MSTPTQSRASIGRSPTRTHRTRAILAVVAGLLLVTLAASPALGHAELVTSDPAAGATLDTPPTTVTLTFSAGLDAAKSSFRILGPEGEAGVGKAAENGSKVMTAEGLTLGPGAYTVEWTSVADDGDLERGKFAFTVNEPPATPTAPVPNASPSAAQTEAAPTAPTESPAPSATPNTAPPATPSASGGTGTPAASGGDVLIPIVAALALVAVIGGLVLRRNRAA